MPNENKAKFAMLEDLAKRLLADAERMAAGKEWMHLKTFAKLRGATGGVFFGVCEHGVEYPFKIMVRGGRAPRDAADLQLSMRRMIPIFVIYDYAGGLVRHMRIRNPLIFGEHAGLVGRSDAPMPETPRSLAELRAMFGPEAP